MAVTAGVWYHLPHSLSRYNVARLLGTLSLVPRLSYGPQLATVGAGKLTVPQFIWYGFYHLQSSDIVIYILCNIVIRNLDDLKFRTPDYIVLSILQDMESYMYPFSIS